MSNAFLILPLNVAFCASILSRINLSRTELQNVPIGFYLSGSLQCWTGLGLPKASGETALPL